MECPQCSGVEMEEFTTESGALLGKCGECSSLWVDSGDLTRVLLHNNLPGLDALGGRANLGETAGTCPDDLTDLVVIEAPKNHGHAYAMCEVCGGIWLSDSTGYAGDSGEALVGEILDFFRGFAPAKTRA